MNGAMAASFSSWRQRLAIHLMLLQFVVKVGRICPGGGVLKKCSNRSWFGHLSIYNLKEWFLVIEQIEAVTAILHISGQLFRIEKTTI